MERINNHLKRMPETKAWSGQAHDAASAMFGRARQTTSEFSRYTTAIGNALSEGAGTIGTARKALLDKADEIDRGPLNVSEGWVVLIDPGAQSAEQNGFAPPATGGLPDLMLPGTQRPADDLPDPRNPIGLTQQATVRGEQMAMTVRETTSRYNDEGHFEKTLIMQDGSRHVITEYEPDYKNGVPDMTTDDHYDTDGNLISWTSSTRTPGGYKKTIMNWADGTQYVIDETPEGVRTAAFNLPDGRHGVLPPDSPLLVQTVPDCIGDVLTGLETHIDRGGKIPMLSMDAVEKVGAGAKYGGPALGVMSATYDFLAAPTPADKCVSVFAGTFALVGNAGGAAGGAMLGGPVPFPGVAPALAVGGSVAGGAWMKSVGTKVGEVLCGA
ncbi:hypothetical protein AU192_09825 [Mycobacterium lehmannii]|uniref:Uncharacterized protein n=1 Tax=Mycobacterium lehmannii TaxID=2048550 RepID=A0A117JHP2_9MYCO|nr:hypothetical protein [Mycobacterium lehmannii]KUI07763.1 hypothetical protein AU192_09825 [Mycobacterium lehmannii]